jgi:hypothetical protein
MSGRSETFVQNVGVVSDSSLVRIIEPLITQVTVPVSPEIGPVAPASATTDTSIDGASAEKPATATKPPEKTQEKPPVDQKRRHKREQ